MDAFIPALRHARSNKSAMLVVLNVAKQVKILSSLLPPLPIFYPNSLFKSVSFFILFTCNIIRPYQIINTGREFCLGI
jgi:hypothetical protein